jgi:lysozyme family protein
MARGLGCVAAALALVCAVFAAPAGARGRANVAALQVALGAVHLYGGTVDGYYGPGTRRGVRRFQRRKRLIVDGVVGSQTRRALGRRGRPGFGSRTIRPGARGWDVAALQFLLAWQGFPSGSFDGGYGPRTQAALRRFQRHERIGVDGVAGPRTLARLRARPPRSKLRLARPIRNQPSGDRFGPRGNRFHAGLDFPAPRGWNVRSAGRGRVRYRGWLSGYGRVVIVAHRRGMRTLYAHLSRTTVRRGERVSAGERIGLVGSTGNSTGPHLHFEVVVRGANVDPRTALG